MHGLHIPLYARDGSIVAHTIIDAADVPAVIGHRWFRDSHGYARCKTKDRGAFLMHRELLGLMPGDGLEGDHINRNRLDNRRSNLRALTPTAHAQNRPSYKGSTSRFRSVYWAKDKGRWRARQRLGGIPYHLGYFDDEIEAALAAEEFRNERMPHAEPDPSLAALF